MAGILKHMLVSNLNTLLANTCPFSSAPVDLLHPPYKANWYVGDTTTFSRCLGFQLC